MTTIEITSVLPDGPNAHGSVSVRLVDAGTGGAVGDEVIAGTQRVKLDVDGYGTIDLTPTADIDPPGTCWAFSVDGASPAVVRCITVPDSDTPVSWTDEAIQVGAPVPPDLFPLATSGGVGDVMTVVDDGNGKKLALRPPTGGGGGGADHAVALFIESIEDSDTNAVFYGSGAVLPRSALAGLAVLVVSGTNFGLRTLTASGPLTAGATLAPGDIIVSKGQGYSAVASTADGTTVNAVTGGVLAADIGFAGSGVLAGAGTVQEGLNQVEGALDGQRDVSTVFLAAVPGLATLMSGPVADVNQPTGDDGRQVQKGDFVATLGDVDVDGNGWIHIVDIDTGQWGIVPSSGPSTPVGAGAWANALTTNYLRGGDTIVLASGAIGTYRVNRTNGGHTFTRGGPSRIADPYEEGEWVFTAPDGAAGVSLGETSGSAYRGDRGKTAYDHSQVTTGNPHSVTKAEVGLGNVTNDAQIVKATGTAKGSLVGFSATATPVEITVGADGKVPLANANETSGVGWYAPGSTHSFASGVFTPNAAFVSATMAMTANRLYACKPFLIRKRRTFDRIGLMHVSGVSTTGVIRIDLAGITEVDGLVGAQLFGEYSLDVTATGASVSSSVIKTSGTISLTLDPGIYYPRVVAQWSGGTGPTVNARSNDYPPIYPDAFTQGAGNTMPIQASVSGAIPTSSWTPTSAVNTSPVVYLRAT